MGCLVRQHLDLHKVNQSSGTAGLSASKSMHCTVEKPNKASCHLVVECH